MNIQEALIIFFKEDVQDGDHTSLATIPEKAERKAQLIVKDEGIIAGVELAENIFHFVDNSLEMEHLIKDGCKVKYGDIAFKVNGKAQSILKAERIMLNLMQRMSGIATLSRQFADKVSDLSTKILDTRKTTPGIRYFEKWAVRIGGCHNHRMGLYDMIMIKDNHHDYAGGIVKAIDRTYAYLKEKKLALKVEIEVRNLEELQLVINDNRVDRIMLDNFSPQEIKEALKQIPSKFETEASGGINLKTVRAYAETGIQYLSVGALTHSVKSLDMSLKAY